MSAAGKLSIKDEKDAAEQEQIKPKSLSWKSKSKIRAKFFLVGNVKTISLVFKSTRQVSLGQPAMCCSRNRKSGLKTISSLQIPSSLLPVSFSQNYFYEVLSFQIYFPICTQMS